MRTSSAAKRTTRIAPLASAASSTRRRSVGIGMAPASSSKSTRAVRESASRSASSSRAASASSATGSPSQRENPPEELAGKQRRVGDANRSEGRSKTPLEHPQQHGLSEPRRTRDGDGARASAQGALYRFQQLLGRPSRNVVRGDHSSPRRGRSRIRAVRRAAQPRGGEAPRGSREPPRWPGRSAPGELRRIHDGGSECWSDRSGRGSPWAHGCEPGGRANSGRSPRHSAASGARRGWPPAGRRRASGRNGSPRPAPGPGGGPPRTRRGVRRAGAPSPPASRRRRRASPPAPSPIPPGEDSPPADPAPDPARRSRRAGRGSRCRARPREARRRAGRRRGSSRPAAAREPARAASCRPLRLRPGRRAPSPRESPGGGPRERPQQPRSRRSCRDPR